MLFVNADWIAGSWNSAEENWGKKIKSFEKKNVKVKGMLHYARIAALRFFVRRAR